MKKTIFLILLILQIVFQVSFGPTFSQTASADFNLKDWQFKKDINVNGQNNPSGQNGYVKVIADTDVESHTTWNDIRIVSGTQEVPYQVESGLEQNTDTYYKARMLNLVSVNSQQPTGAIQFMLDLGSSGLLHNQIHIDTNSKNFRRQVSVASADSLLPLSSKQWQGLTNAGYIYNYHDQQAGFDVSNTDVSYPKSTARFLRVTISDGEGPVVVSNAQVYQFQTSNPEIIHLTVPVSAEENALEHTTELILDMAKNGIPSSSATISTTNTNFNRKVIIQSSSDQKNWTRIADEYIFSVHTPLFNGNQLTVTYPESRQRYIRLVIFNYDDSALKFQNQAVVTSVTRSIIFQAIAGQNYSLYYGNAKAPAPHYDLAKIFPYMESNNLPKASLGEQQNNSQFQAEAPVVPPFSERYPGILNAMLVLLVIVIGFFVFIYVKKIKNI